MAFLSLPWLFSETNGLDLEVFKDKNFKNCSNNLTKNTPSNILVLIKCICIQYLCLIPKNVCSQWRTQIIRRCIKDEADNELRIFTIRHLPYLIYFLGVSSNSLVSQLIHPAMTSEKSPEVIISYSSLLEFIACLISRKCVVIRKPIESIDFGKSMIKKIFKIENNSKYSSNSEFVDNLLSLEIFEYFTIVCTCCDKKFIISEILPKLTQSKNIEMLQSLFKRPKNVDSQLIIQFIHMCGLQGLKSEVNTDEKLKENEAEKKFLSVIKTYIMKNLERAIKHLEFHFFPNLKNFLQSQNACNMVSHQNLTNIYKESLKLSADSSICVIKRLEFTRTSISKLIRQKPIINTFFYQNLSSINSESNNYDFYNDDKHFKVTDASILSRTNNQNDHDVNTYNIEDFLCEGFEKAKTSKNILDLFIYLMGLGRLALSFVNPNPHEYIFLCVKRLLEIIYLSSSFLLKSKIF